MPRRREGARLWLQKPRRDRTGRIVEQAVWCIRDGSIKRGTGLGPGAHQSALDDALADYVVGKRKLPRDRDRHPAQVQIADVIAIYAEDVAPGQARPNEVAARLDKLLDFFAHKQLDKLNAKLCSQYVEARGAVPAARRELEDLRAAVRHHWKQGLCLALTPVVLPDRAESRVRWLTRAEAARLLQAAHQYREVQKGWPTGRRALRHVARFILVGLYTGTRAGAICGAALQPTEGRGWVDLEHGVFYRRPAGRRESRKRQPSIRIPPPLLRHMRRWARVGLSRKFVVEWNGKPVRRINKGFRSARRLAGLDVDVVPHVLRHTCATWLAQRGAPVHEICGFLGMTRETFERVYGHHHPDHQQGAVNALSSRPRQFPDRNAATDREQTPSKVVGIDGKR
jgi:integrase